MKGWTTSTVEAAKKPDSVTQETRTPPQATPVPPTANEGDTGHKKPKSEILTTPAVASQHYIGPYQLSVANGTHFPGRMRFAGVGPSDEGMLRAVLAAMKDYHDSKTVKP